MKKVLFAVLAGSVLSSSAMAAGTVWTDWTSGSSSSASGTLGGVAVGVSTSPGGVGFVQTSGGTNYYNPWPVAGYTPDNTDIVALDGGGTKTITFATPIKNLVMAFVSWNTDTNNTPAPSITTFSQAFKVVGAGCGYWGCGTFQNVTPTSFESSPYSNEIHGVLRFSGPVTSLTFTDDSENWHGFTLGAVVPEPASWALMIGGFGVVGFAARRRRQTLAVTA